MNLYGRLTKILVLFLLLSIPTLLWGRDVKLQWNANNEQNLLGYLLYYKIGSGCTEPPSSGTSCFPVDEMLYDGTGAQEGMSPIVLTVVAGVTEIPPTLTNIGVPSGVSWYGIENKPTCEFSIHNLPDDEQNCFALRAFDIEGMWSIYSNEACVSGVTTVPGPPPTPQNLRVINFESTPFVIISGVPFTLQGTTPEEHQVGLAIEYIPNDASMLVLEMDVYDPDFVDEGELLVNGVKVADLFPGTLQDAATLPQIVEIPMSVLVQGNNTLTFRHTSTQGYRIDAIRLLHIRR